MLSIWTRLLIVALIISNCFAEESGSLCIAPAIVDATRMGDPALYCEAGKYSLKIDGQVMVWPLRESIKIPGLDLKTRHRVIVFSDHKPQQSFTFRFSEFESPKLCLFLNDLYRTVNLREDKRCPCCKSK